MPLHGEKALPECLDSFLLFIAKAFQQRRLQLTAVPTNNQTRTGCLLPLPLQWGGRHWQRNRAVGFPSMGWS